MRRESIVLLAIVLTLTLLGVYTVYSASAAQGNVEARLLRHVVYLGIGLLALAACLRFDYRRFSEPFLFRFIVCLSVTLLVAVLIPGIGDVRNGAQRWIEIAGFSFQPSEFAKLALLLLLAVKLSVNSREVRSFWEGYFPAICTISFFCLLILLERDLGTPAVLGAAAFIVLFVAGVRIRYLIPTGAAGIGLVYLFARTSEYRMKRLTAFRDPWSYADEEGYQLIQSLQAFAQGGVWGVGPGASEQKLFYLPEAHTDFIFAVWGEEMGLLGTLLFVGLFTAFVMLALRIAAHASDRFGALLATGIACLIGLQAAFNMAVAVGLLPTKGLPLPFISWGGTSLVVFMALSGILISVGLQAKPPQRRALASSAA